MLTIRLQRTGTKNAASFRIVVAEKSQHVSKKFTEVLGHYNPRNKEFNIKNTERLNYWLSHNIDLSPTINNLLVTKGLKKGDKVKAFNIPKKPVVEAPVAAETAATEAPTAETPSEAAPVEPTETTPEAVEETAKEIPADEAPSETSAVAE
jgi:small subunit ribosomal protein S16